MRDYYGMIEEETFWDQHRTGEDKMKKIITSLLTIMLGLLMSVNVMCRRGNKVLIIKQIIT